jgi:hypothetical protein
MSRHVTYRGVTLDMDSIRRENEKVPAMGNMRVNAKGDQLKGGMITRTADQIARDNHRVQTAIIRSGLKGPQPVSPAMTLDKPKPTPKAKDPVKTKEVELPSGDIVIEEDKSES